MFRKYIVCIICLVVISSHNIILSKTQETEDEITVSEISDTQDEVTVSETQETEDEATVSETQETEDEATVSETPETEDEITVPKELSPTKQAICDTLRKPLVYVPWREDYISDTHEKPKPRGCPFCLIRDGDDSEYLVLMRCKYNYVMLNHYPYTRGHIMIVPYAHVETLSDLSVEEKKEMMALITQCCEILPGAVEADGFNIGINVGKASAASIPEHIHVQVLPRFSCEPIGYLNLLGETRIVYWNLQKLYQRLKPYFINYHLS